jgi:nucleoside-diphosphate-sugar epimerase
MRAADAPSGPVLITGASGFIGRRLRDTLLGRGQDVVALARPSSPEPERGRAARADYGDLDALTALMRAERPRLILHVAGATKGVRYPDFEQANVLPTRNLLAALDAARHTPERFVLVSSLAAYGPSTAEHPKVESDPRQPIEHYGASKKAAEEVVEAGKVPFTILRPGGVYGPGDVDYLEIFKMVAGGWNVFFGNRHRLFSAIYVDDAVEGILQAAAHPGATNRGYFLSAGAPVSWETFHGTVVEVAGKRVRELDLPEALVTLAALGGELATKLDGRPRLFNRQKATMGRQAAWTCASAAAERDFGFTPKVDLLTGVARAYEWYRQEGWL